MRMLFQSTVKGLCLIYRECEVWKAKEPTFPETAALLPRLHKTEHGIIVITFMVAMHASKSLSGHYVQYVLILPRFSLLMVLA